VKHTTIALVDDHPLVSYSIVTALRALGITCVPIQPGSLDDMRAAIFEAEPTLVLLDLDLGPFGASLSLIEPLTAADIRVMMLTAETDRVRLAEALERGASRIVLKSADFTALIETIRLAVESDLRSDPLTDQLLAELYDHRRKQADARAPFENLTAREKEVLAALATGDSVHAIARAWVVSETTIRSHVRAILLKLNVQSQLQAVVKAVRHGWISPEEPAV
jgi:DNA-binding NarL/FixJ family response regulator